MHIHCHFQSAWPSPYSCAGSLLQRSHTALALGPCGLRELQSELHCCHTEGEGAKWYIKCVLCGRDEEVREFSKKYQVPTEPH